MAAALYLASLQDGETLTQIDVAAAAGVREVKSGSSTSRLRKVVGGRLERRHRKWRFGLSVLEASQPRPVEDPA